MLVCKGGGLDQVISINWVDQPENDHLKSWITHFFMRLFRSQSLISYSSVYSFGKTLTCLSYYKLIACAKKLIYTSPSCANDVKETIILFIEQWAHNLHIENYSSLSFWINQSSSVKVSIWTRAFIILTDFRTHLLHHSAYDDCLLPTAYDEYLSSLI